MNGALHINSSYSISINYKPMRYNDCFVKLFIKLEFKEVELVEFATVKLNK